MATNTSVGNLPDASLEPSEPEPTIRVGVVGLGMGRAHIEPFNAHHAAKVTALCDTNSARLTEVADEFGVEQTFSSIDELLKARVVDVVSLAVPNHLHEPFTLKALSADLDVLCEKPLALNAEQARRMVNAAQRSSRILGVHYNHRLSQEHQHVRAMFDAGELGEVFYIRAGWVRQRGIPYWGNGWFCDREQAGGGTLIDTGVHMIDLALYACGYPTVVSVSGQTYAAFGDADVPELEMDVEDAATAYLRCDNGVTVALELSWAGFALEREQVYCAVHGSKAGAHWSWTQVDSEWNRQLEVTARSHGALTRQVITEFPKDLPTVQSDFIDAVRERRQPICNGQQGWEVMRVLDAIYESHRTGREVILEAD